MWRSTRCFAEFASSLMSLTCSMAGARILGTQIEKITPKQLRGHGWKAEGLWIFFFAVKSWDFGGFM